MLKCANDKVYLFLRRNSDQLKRGKFIFETDEMILLPGFEVESGVELQIINHSYQYCNSYGPGKKN